MSSGFSGVNLFVGAFCGSYPYMLVFGSSGLRGKNRVFQNKCKHPEEIVRSVVWAVSEWAIRKVEFVGVSLEALTGSWPAHFQRGEGVLF